MVPGASVGASMVVLKARFQQKVVRKLGHPWVRGTSSHVTAAVRSTGCP